MDLNAYLDEKRISDFTSSTKKKLFDLYDSGTFKGDQDISKKSLEIGLFLFDIHPELQEDTEVRGRYYIHALTPLDPRIEKIKSLCDPQTIWENHTDLLYYLFSDEMVPLILEAWKMFPNLMYQTGHARRSFRAPDLKEVHFRNQLNFIIKLVSDLNYTLSLEEYILYSNHTHSPNLAHLYAAAINMGNAEIKTLLLDIVYMRHDVGRVSAPIIKGILLSEFEEGWEAVEKLLLSAQRQEGLRQTILECLDECALGAMKRLIRLIIDHKLARFSSVVRAIDVWAGFGWENERETTVRRFLELGDKYLNAPELIPQAMKSRDNAEVYMALWAQGVYDVKGCPPLIEEVLKQGTLEKTLLSLYLVRNIGLTKINAHYGLRFLTHENLMIFSMAFHVFYHDSCIQILSKEEKRSLFDLLGKRLESIPKDGKTFTGKGFSWLSVHISKELIFRLMIDLVDFEDEQEVDRLLVFWEGMPLNPRESITKNILKGFSYYSYYSSKDEEPETLTKRQRDFAFRVIRDRAVMIKNTAIKALGKAVIELDELDVFIDMLKSKSADTRSSILALLMKQESLTIKTCIEKLLTAGNQGQRLAGLDLLTQLKKQFIDEDNWIQNQAILFSERPKLTVKEELILTPLLTQNEEILSYNAENGFGLFDPNDISPNQFPQAPESGIYLDRLKKHTAGLSQSPADINRHLQYLKALYIQHQEYEYTVENWDNSTEAVLLGNSFQQIKRNTEGMTREERFYNYPLASVWEKWAIDSGIDSCDLLVIHLGNRGENAAKIYGGDLELLAKIQSLAFFPEIPKLQTGDYWRNPLEEILKILMLKFPFRKTVDFLEGQIRTIFTSLEEQNLHTLFSKNPQKNQGLGWIFNSNREIVNQIYQKYASLCHKMTDDQFSHFWPIEKWKTETFTDPENNNKLEPTSLYNYCRAFSLNLIGKNELMTRIMRSDAIHEINREKTPRDEEMIYETFPFLPEFIVPIKARILEIELKRGDSSTSVTHLAQNLNRIYGIHYFISILNGMGKDNLNRGYIYRWSSTNYNKKEILSTLLKRCYPLSEEDQAQFNKAIKSTEITEKRLIEAATYAPQWLPMIANYLKWESMPSAVWWLHAHTNSYHSAETEAEIGKYSKVSLNDFRDGGVDTAWFKEIYADLGKKKWSSLYDAAKYISSGGGHKRAQLYADVILKKTKITEIKKRVKEKRNQDYLRALGLVPLNSKTPDKDLLNRYRLLQKFKKESKQFGAQRQASEGRSVQISMENLARTAGYSDPLRLTWAMETEEAQQIMAKANLLTIGEMEIRLSINDQGIASLNYKKNGVTLKSLPAKLRKDKGVLELKSYAKILKEQFRRTRASLETAMVNGDAFSVKEIQHLMHHPVVAPILQKLVLKSGENLGFWKADHLENPQGDRFPVAEEIIIAHCSDLFENGNWNQWQQYCFDHQLVQPFKQIFRELYIPTEDELNEKAVSRRYAGHQVQPKKTVALLKSRGWIVDYEMGLQKVFHKENFIAKMYAMADWFSPADVESPTLETVEFVDRKTFKNKAFTDIAPRAFSEIMRDIDLVVSVAHVGDVDPEVSQSSIELRTAIARETVRLFKLDNVELSGNHAIIQGRNGKYSVHLGSAVVHQITGTYLSILPVHSQKRGKMFLPFLDNDPKSAEVLSKIILLAKDHEIQDPTILRQIN